VPLGEGEGQVVASAALRPTDPATRQPLASDDGFDRRCPRMRRSSVVKSRFWEAMQLVQSGRVERPAFAPVVPGHAANITASITNLLATRGLLRRACWLQLASVLPSPSISLKSAPSSCNTCRHRSWQFAQAACPAVCPSSFVSSTPLL
jgi:hypothetical protein